jgi:hypothetical protein
MRVRLTADEVLEGGTLTCTRCVEEFGRTSTGACCAEEELGRPSTGVCCAEEELGRSLTRCLCAEEDLGQTLTGVRGSDRPGSARSSREGRHTTSTPTGLDREQKLKDGFEGISTIKEARPHASVMKLEVSSGQGSTRRMCQSLTESSDDEDDGYLAITRRKRAEGRSTSPKS